MNTISQRPDVSEFRKRYKWLVLAVFVLFGLLIAKLVSLQIFQHIELRQIAKSNIVRSFSLQTSRGVVRDRNGSIIAGSRESWNVYVVPAYLDFEQTWPKLTDMVGLYGAEKSRIEEKLRAQKADDVAKLRQDPKEHKVHDVLLREDVSRDVVATLETNKRSLPGVTWVSVPLRYYPRQNLTFHVLGYVNEVTAEDIEAEKTKGLTELRDGDRVGRAGLEHSLEAILRGKRGWKKYVVDARGERRTSEEDLAQIDDPREEPPSPGKDVRLTLDFDLMEEAKKAFTGQLAGGLVMIEVKTGRVLVMFSKPSVDPNEFVAGLSKQQAEVIVNDPLRPLINKTSFEAYFPGSTMKPFSALAALKARVITPHTVERCEHIYHYFGGKFKCEGTHGDISLHDAIRYSCNIYFYHLGERLGIDHLAEMASDFGLGQKTGISLLSEVSGLVPTKAWYNQHFGGRYRPGFALNAAIGQGNTKVTILQQALAFAALSNGGELWTPKMIEQVEEPQGEGMPRKIVSSFQPELRRRIELNPDDLAQVLNGLYGVVNEEGSTGFRAYHASDLKVIIAGKTGTAQVSRVAARTGVDPRELGYFNQDHAWFAGFAPYKNPEVAVVAMVEHAGPGGKIAAPIAMRLLAAYFAQKAPPAADPQTRKKAP